MEGKAHEDGAGIMKVNSANNITGGRICCCLLCEAEERLVMEDEMELSAYRPCTWQKWHRMTSSPGVGESDEEPFLRLTVVKAWRQASLKRGIRMRACAAGASAGAQGGGGGAGRENLL